MRRINWQIWAGLLLSIVAVFSYPLVFIRWPITRDVPWVNVLLILGAVALLFQGLRRGWARGRFRIVRMAVTTLAAGASVALLGPWLYLMFVTSHHLPPSNGAPQVGQRAPDFTLQDAQKKPVALTSLLSEPINGQAPRGVLLIFYRGYW